MEMSPRRRRRYYCIYREEKGRGRLVNWGMALVLCCDLCDTLSQNFPVDVPPTMFVCVKNEFVAKINGRLW